MNNDIPSYLKKHTLTRAILAKTIRKKTHIPKNQTYKIIDQFLFIMTEPLVQNIPIKLKLFGTFTIHFKKAMIGHNPKTLKKVMVPAHKVIRFKIAPTFKKRMNNNIHDVR